EEINIHRGLKQGDPLAPFLFLLVVEGLSGAISREEELGMFKGFKVGNNGLFVSHLQYADDTIFLGEASVENPWTLKTIIRCFELASGLKVNFAKSNVIGVNVSADFLNLAERILHCSVGSIPFTYLGLPVGANPRKEGNWKPLLVSLSRKLGDRRIALVSWDNVCRPKNCGGLGIRDLRAVVPYLETMSGGGKGYRLLGAWLVALGFQMDEGAVCG
ncbi:LINE-1 reverse transcriptase like, partial [Trifolium medium]|nr:LINE-1 reverse transcriptase like [Trifolium medium]